MTNMQAMQNILSNLQNKYRGLIEIENYTKQMLEALNIDDTAVFGITLDMRQNVMKRIDSIDEQNKAIILQLGQSDKDKINGILYPKDSVTVKLDNVLQTDIFDTQKRILILLKRIVAINDEINKKIQVQK